MLARIDLAKPAVKLLQSYCISVEKGLRKGYYTIFILPYTLR